MKHSETHIQTKRLWLREIDESDTETIVSLRSDPKIYRFFTKPHEITREEHLNWYRTRYCRDENRIEWLAIDDDTGQVIGIYGAKSAEGDTVEVSYLTVESVRGAGYAMEAVEAILQWAKMRWSSKRAVAVVHRENQPSSGFIQKLGFCANQEKNGFIVFSKEL